MRFFRALAFALPMMAAFMFVSDASALTVTGGIAPDTISTTSGVVTLSDVVMTCDFNNEIAVGTGFMFMQYTASDGSSTNPVEFDVSGAAGIVAGNDGQTTVTSPPVASASQLNFYNGAGCMTADTVTISGVKVKVKNPTVLSEGTLTIWYRSGAQVGSSVSSHVDTMGPQLVKATLQDVGGAHTGTIETIALEFTESIVYPLNDFHSSHWSAVTNPIADLSLMGDISIDGVAKAAAMQYVILSASAVSGELGTFGYYTFSPTALNTMTDDHGNPVRTDSIQTGEQLTPVVKSISPSGVVAKNAPITVTFSEAMNMNTAQVTIEPPVPLGLSWDSVGEVLTITPQNQDYDTQYEVTILATENGGILPLPTLPSQVEGAALSGTWVYSTGSEPAGAPTISSFSINNGAATTDSAIVTLGVTTANGDEIQFATNAAMSDATVWDELDLDEGTLGWTLKPGVGTKQVCARVKNVTSGALSNVLCDSIVLQSGGVGVPVNPSLSINNGAQKTNGQLVKLQLGASGATGMAISNNSSFDGAEWTDFASVYDWFLSNGAGDKTVYVMYGSDTGAVTATTSASIEFAPTTAAPTGSLTILDGVPTTKTINVHVDITANNADKVMYATKSDMSDAGSYESIALNKPWILTPGLGVKQVCAQFKNSSTNKTSGVVCDTIILKEFGSGYPTGYSITTNSGQSSTNSSTVTLKLGANNATKMAISNRSDFLGAKWESFKTSKTWTLASGTGNKTLYVMMAASNGSVTPIFTDDIVVNKDTTGGGSGNIITPPPKTPSKKVPLPTGLSGGMLVKKVGDSAVYYVGEDGYRYVFPHQKVFLSWYTEAELQTKDKGGLVVTIAASTLASMKLGGNVTYRPGVKLVKIQSDVNVYAVAKNGVLKWVKNAGVASQLYGANWAKNVDDINVAFFVNYGFGTDIASTSDYSVSSQKSSATSITMDKSLSAD